MQLDSAKWFDSLSQVALAFFGGLIGALMRKEAASWSSALLGALGAGFVGFLIAKFCHAMGVSDDMTYVFVGVSGWLGAARTIDYLERIIEERTGVAMPRISPEMTVGEEHADETDKEVKEKSDQQQPNRGTDLPNNGRRE